MAQVGRKTIIFQLVTAFGFGALLSASIAAIYVNRLDRIHDAQLDYIVATSRCLRYWGNRSSVSDSEAEFRQNRTGLLTDTHGDYAVITDTPGLKMGAKAEVRNDFPITGPQQQSTKDIYGRPSHVTDCNPYAYEYDYNINMLRLLGRTGDIELRVSPELK